MKQQEFEIILALLKKNIREEKMYEECYNILRLDRILLHQLGLFETPDVISIFKDKIALQELKIQQHHYTGMGIFFEKLTNYKGRSLQQFIIAANEFGYLLVLSSDMSELIGILKNSKLNFENDLEQQQRLKQIGHADSKLFLFEEGFLIQEI